MATWKPKTVREVVQAIEGGAYVLPVIQRRLVWNDDKMELLFDSLLKGNSFGGIMVMQEEKGDTPLFATRRFSRYGEEHPSTIPIEIEHTTFLVIDGQQRLQAFFMGLKGGKDGKVLYFNLLSSPLDFDFRFAADPDELPAFETGDSEKRQQNLWYPVSRLYDRLREAGGNPNFVADRIMQQRDITSSELTSVARDNVMKFYLGVIGNDTVGMSSVSVDRSSSERTDEEKQRIVELFRRLNDGGTRLSTLDLVASMFKGFDHRMEQFFKDVVQFEDIGISQDEVIKLIFLLQDNHSKEVTQITKEDTEFAIQNRDRIIRALEGVRQFLKYADLYSYYSAGTRSDIPLYFVAYHLFHKTEIGDDQLTHVYDNHDINNPDFLALMRWIYLSLLNGIFSRGCGWIPYRTGIRKISRVLRQYKGQVFPTKALFDVYANHPLRFREALTVERLDAWDRDFVFYVIYGHQSMSGRDIDHIHPRSLLEAWSHPPYEPGQIHSVANYQLLDPGTNRNEKRAKSLADWIESGVKDKATYLKRHLIPENPEYWKVDNFPAFLKHRGAKIVDKLLEPIPSSPIQDSSSIEAIEAEHSVSVASDFDIKSYLDLVPESHRTHPALLDETSWFDIYKAWGVGRRWYGSYRKELHQYGIVTVADMARAVMIMRLEAWKDSGYGIIYRFRRNPSDGLPLELNTSKFGGWAWKITLDELEKRNFDWRAFLVE